MSTVTYQEAMRELGMSRSAIERRLRITGTPVSTNADGRAEFDLDTLVDAWAGHRDAIEAEREAREKVTEASISVSIPQSQRDELDTIAAKQGRSVAAVVRDVLHVGLKAYIR